MYPAPYRPLAGYLAGPYGAALDTSWTWADRVAWQAIDMALAQTSLLSGNQVTLRSLRAGYRVGAASPADAIERLQIYLKALNYPSASAFLLAQRISARSASAAPAAPQPSGTPPGFVAPQVLGPPGIASMPPGFNPNIPGTFPSGPEVQQAANVPGQTEKGITDQPWFGPALAAGVLAVLGGVAIFAMPAAPARKTNPRRRVKRRKNCGGAPCSCNGYRSNPRRGKRRRNCGCKG